VHSPAERQTACMDHEVGHSPPRGLPRVPTEEANELLSDLAGKPVELSENLAMSSGPTTCPACGSSSVEDALRYQVDGLGLEEVHPVVWGEGYALADTYVCKDCDAGWIEGSKPHPITWVRPWRSEHTQET
jgi:hypothetical protein